MPGRSLHIAWLGSGPGRADSGGVPGVAAELLVGLARLGHRIDCYLPGVGHAVPDRVAESPQVTFTWGTSNWRWDGWYNRTKIGAFVTGLIARAVGSIRLRREVTKKHEVDPYDLVYQFSNIEALAMPPSLRRSVPLVIHPETHIAGELKSMLAERKLSLRSQPPYVFAITISTMLIRVLVQRSRIRRASLLICISSVFRDHLVHDYGYPVERTTVIPNPVRLERFRAADCERGVEEPPRILVIGRISARKGLEDVTALARVLLQRDVQARLRIVGGPSLWSDYTKLLEDLPAANSEYVGRIPPAQIPAELSRGDLLLQASKYEPFGLTVGEALAAGVAVVATTEVGAIEQVDRSVAGVVAPGDVEGMATAIAELLERLRASPADTRSRARAEAERLFAPEIVCREISAALGELVEERASSS
jgi:glycosyltransferase involved in cell wall biosynthesis